MRKHLIIALIGGILINLSALSGYSIGTSPTGPVWKDVPKGDRLDIKPVKTVAA